MLARLVMLLSAAWCGQFVGCAAMYSPQCGGCPAPCGCGVECGCAAPCGCGDECGCGVPCCHHPSMGGQTWDCCDGEGPKLCYCTGPCGECCHRGCCGCIARWWHGDGCGCAACCGEAACGCENTCGCEPCCDAGCGCEPCCATECAPCYVSPCKALWNALCGCSGCDCELYWSEWHNDPPRCCDPCDQCGNWIGPGEGCYRAPYAHSYAVASGPQGAYAEAPKQVVRNQAPAKRSTPKTARRG
jgi:hypothetical protein